MFVCIVFMSLQVYFVRNLGFCVRSLQKKKKQMWMKIFPKRSNCRLTPGRPTAGRFNYPWWRGSKAQWAGMLSVSEVIRGANVFSPIVEEPSLSHLPSIWIPFTSRRRNLDFFIPAEFRSAKGKTSLNVDQQGLIRKFDENVFKCWCE